MKKTFPFFLALATVLIASSCAKLNPIAPTPPFIPTKPAMPLAKLTPVCISTQPTQADIDRALMFTGVTFSASEWERSYTVSENRVSVSWLNNSLGALAYLEALIFPCGYEEPDVNNYFSDENWKLIFQSYESYTSTSPMCKTDSGLRLYEFKAVSQGFDYDTGRKTIRSIASLRLCLSYPWVMNPRWTILHPASSPNFQPALDKQEKP
jgi:hypothetical protein